jgi:hypothetical protein
MIISGPMLRRSGKGNQPARPRVSFAESDDPGLDAPAVKENSPPKSEAARIKPQAPLSSKFSQRWGDKGCQPSASAEVFDGECPDPVDILAEPPKREKASLTAEAVLQEINLMVERVKEICSQRPK